jgi:hypothetical protein
MSKNSVFHIRTNHMNLKHHYIKETIEDEKIEIKHVKIGDQLTDIFTKSLLYGKFIYLTELLVMTNKNIKGVLKLIFLF